MDIVKVKVSFFHGRKTIHMDIQKVKLYLKAHISKKSA